jgi:hypothetical protein
LEGLNVVKIDDGIKIDENSGARSDQTKNHSGVRFGSLEDARSLNVEEGVVTALSSGIKVVDEGSWIIEIESAILVILASC